MRVNVLGNGDYAGLFKRGTYGKLLVCNMPPIELPPEEVYGSCMVDFKMMAALQEGAVDLGQYDWILGNRPRRWMEQSPAFYLKYSQNIKGFWTHVPPYAQLPGHTLAQAATNYSCGHMAVDYACRKMLATEVHLYGFDSLFDLNLSSCTDKYLHSNRSDLNTHRLATNWRPIWAGLFKEFSDVSFIVHHRHDKIKIPRIKNGNVTVEVGILEE
tara:strand:- start:3346 stop:3987 length:642 start_codon:yes stop_codon:yes gene_type:complete